MIIRVRSRDGIERVQVADEGAVGHLYSAVSSQLGIPLNDLRLSKNPKLVTSQSTVYFHSSSGPQLVSGEMADRFSDLDKQRMSLKSAGIENGTVVYALYSEERDVQPAYRKSKFEERAFGGDIRL